MTFDDYEIALMAGEAFYWMGYYQDNLGPP
jgi:hypothetical protein